MKTALLIVDMINPLEFPEGAQLLRHAKPVSRRIARLRERFHKANRPVIYVNDNFGQWKEDWKFTTEKCLNSRGRPLLEGLIPAEQDFMILKPMHSAFYATPLDTLLGQLKVRSLVVTGIAGNICVLFTVNDAYMRRFEIVVPRDAIASNTIKDNAYTLRQFKEVFKIPTPMATSVRIR